MTKQEFKKTVKLAIKNGMDTKIHHIHVDCKSSVDAVVNVSVIYGKFNIKTVNFSLQRLAKDSGFYSIYSISGYVNIYHIQGINKELKSFPTFPGGKL